MVLTVSVCVFVVTQTDLSCWSGRCVYCKKPKEDSLTQSLRKLPAGSQTWRAMPKSITDSGGFWVNSI